MSMHEWVWFSEAQPPSDTEILILIYCPDIDEIEDEGIYIDAVNSNFIEDQRKDYPKYYEIVAWMTAPTLPDLDQVREKLADNRWNKLFSETEKELKILAKNALEELGETDHE